MSETEFERFTLLVLADESLQEALRDLADRHDFITKVVELGSEREFEFNAEDVASAMRANYRLWIERAR